MSGSSIYILNMKKVSGLRGGMLSAAPQVRVRIVCPTAAMCVDYETLTVTSRNPHYDECFKIVIPSDVPHILKISVITGTDSIVGEASVDLKAQGKDQWTTYDLQLGGTNATGTVSFLARPLLKNPTILPVRARRLMNRDSMIPGSKDLSDPYGLVTGLISPTFKWGQTNTVYDCLWPEFEAKPILVDLINQIPIGGKLVHLKVGLWDEDQKSSDDALGHVIIPWVSIFNDGGVVLLEEMKLKGEGSKGHKENTVTVAIGVEGDEPYGSNQAGAIASLDSDQKKEETSFDPLPPAPSSGAAAEESATPPPKPSDEKPASGGGGGGVAAMRKLTHAVQFTMVRTPVVLQSGRGFKIADCKDDIEDKYTLGLAWDSVPVAAGKKPIDLDASCLMLGDDLQQIDKVYYGGLKSKDGSMKHHGDERTGASDGDDEEIEFDLEKVDPAVTYMCFCITSFTGQSLQGVKGAKCHLYNTTTKAEVSSFDITNNDSLTGTALLMCILYRGGGKGSSEWFMYAMGQAADGKTADAVLPTFKEFLVEHPIAFNHDDEFAVCKSKKVIIKVPEDPTQIIDYHLDSGVVQHIQLPPEATPGQFVEVSLVEVFEE